MIILIMCANFTNLFMVSSKHHVLSIMSSINFFSLQLASLTPMPILHYLSSTLVVSWSISLSIDDIIITGDNDGVMLILILIYRFSLKDLRLFFFFFVVEVTDYHHGLFLSQCRYIGDLLPYTHMSNAKLVSTLLVTSPTFELHTNITFFDPTKY